MLRWGVRGGKALWCCVSGGGTGGEPRLGARGRGRAQQRVESLEDCAVWDWGLLSTVMLKDSGHRGTCRRRGRGDIDPHGGECRREPGAGSRALGGL